MPDQASAASTLAAAAPSEAWNKCEAVKNRAITQCPRVVFLLEAIQKLGCNVGEAPEKTFVSCAKLDETKAGGFQLQGSEDPHIFLAEDIAVSLGARQVEQTLVHELVHAFDQCRAKVTWENLLHHACTEVRASALSGECDLVEEVNRGIMRKVGGQGEACVRRRAELSVAMNPSCRTAVAGAGAHSTPSGQSQSNGASSSASTNGVHPAVAAQAAEAVAATEEENLRARLKAKAAVDAVFDRCYYDTAPFDRMP